jgi:ABC-type uncharacterized transport system permease subunit
MEPSIGQLLLVSLSALLFGLSGVISALSARRRDNRPPKSAELTGIAGTLVGIGVIVWHALGRGRWQPLNDNFETLIWLAILLAAFVAYVQRVRPLRGMDWFVMPIVVLLLLSAGFFGKSDPHLYQPMVKDAWLWVHRVTAYGGALVFAIAAAAGAMYIISNNRLRRKQPDGGFGSLERLERLTMMSVYMGFALLTIGLVTGLARMSPETGSSLAKLILTTLAWIVYAVVLHAPINPRFRGKRVAMLSVVGFLLIIGTLVAVQFMPGGQG